MDLLALLYLLAGLVYFGYGIYKDRRSMYWSAVLACATAVFMLSCVVQDQPQLYLRNITISDRVGNLVFDYPKVIVESREMRPLCILQKTLLDVFDWYPKPIIQQPSGMLQI